MLRRGAASLAFFVLAFVASQAAAATLGVGAGSLGAGAAAVAACDDAVEVSYLTEYDPALPGYVVSDVVAAGCEGRNLSVSLAGGDGEALTPAGRPAAAAVTAVYVAVAGER